MTSLTYAPCACRLDCPGHQAGADLVRRCPRLTPTWPGELPLCDSCRAQAMKARGEAAPENGELF